MTSVRIELRIDQNDPPRGEIFPPGGGSIAFSGWLELLRILADLLGTGSARPSASRPGLTLPTGGLSGQLHPGADP
jgi:hypothetical protein